MLYGKNQNLKIQNNFVLCIFVQYVLTHCSFLLCLLNISCVLYFCFVKKVYNKFTGIKSDLGVSGKLER